MGKPGKWIRNLLTGKKDKDKEKTASNHSDTTPISSTPVTPPPTTPKEKRRWSFRRSSAGNTPNNNNNNNNNNVDHGDHKKHALAVAAATAVAADAAFAAAQAAVDVIRLTGVTHVRSNLIEEASAVKIQSFFRGYLARKALSALKGLVKLQALVRGHLVRKQATATLRCMQALVTAQNRARAQRLRISDDYNPRRSTHDGRIRQTYQEMDRGMEENIKIVEMDLGESRTNTRNRNSYSIPTDHHRFSTHSVPNHRPYSRQQDHRDVSPAPSALTDVSPRAYSSHFEDYSALSSPQCYSAAVVSNQNQNQDEELYAESTLPYDYEYPFFPNYMANTESSRAKARSQSAPKSRPPEPFERQPSKRRPSIEGRNVPRAVRMQRSSSHVGATAQNYQYPWSIRLDRSSVSLKDSECGSTSTILTNPHYARSLVGFDSIKMR